jgi:hypothetical protein
MKDTRSLHAVPKPGGPSATTSPRAGSANHQATTPTNEEKPMSTDIDPEIQSLADELYDRWQELRHACVEMLASAVLVAAVLVPVGREFVTEVIHHFGNWGWFGAGVGAVLMLDMATTALARLSRAGWGLWLTYHPGSAAVPLAALLANEDGRR